MTTVAERSRMAKAILDFEARRDAKGNLMIYYLPPDDGGGRYEVAGINERYDKPVADKLVALINAKQFAEAERVATEYIGKNTDPAAKYTTVPAIESYARDIYFNRGGGGLVKTLQHALGVDMDGDWGPNSKEAMRLAEKNAPVLLTKLREAREWYERNVVGYRARFWDGLVNRWNNSLVTAKTFTLVPSPPAAPEPTSDSWLSLLLGFVKVLFAKKPAATPVASGAKPPWYMWAEKEIGFHETGDNEGIEKYIELGKCGHLRDPWCAIFANAGLEASNVPGSRSAAARSFERHGSFVKLDGPALGAITTMWRGSPSAGTGHVFYYGGENAHGIIALGGNQDNQVCRQYEPRDRIVGYYWPKGYPLPKTGKVIVNDLNAKEGSET